MSIDVVMKYCVFDCYVFIFFEEKNYIIWRFGVECNVVKFDDGFWRNVVFKWWNKYINGIGLIIIVFYCFVIIVDKKSVFDEYFGKCWIIDL